MSRTQKITQEQSQLILENVGPDLKDKQLILEELVGRSGLTKNQVINRLEKFVKAGKLEKLKTLQDGRTVRYRRKELNGGMLD